MSLASFGSVAHFRKFSSRFPKIIFHASQGYSATWEVACVSIPILNVPYWAILSCCLTSIAHCNEANILFYWTASRIFNYSRNNKVVLLFTSEEKLITLFEWMVHEKWLMHNFQLLLRGWGVIFIPPPPFFKNIALHIFRHLVPIYIFTFLNQLDATRSNHVIKDAANNQMLDRIK